MGSSQSAPKYRPVSGIDVAASALAKVAPRVLTPAIDQARLDAHALVDGFLGRGELSYRSEQHPSRAPRPLTAIDPVEEVLPRDLAKAYAAFKRDVSVVVKGLKGEHPPPLIERKSTADRRNKRSVVNAQPSTTRRMRVAEVVRETDEAVSLRLEDVSGAPVSFQAGQFLSVRADVKGETLWRAYSICTAPGSGEVRITIKRVEGGRVSNQLNDMARVGEVLEVRGPSGRFTLQTSVRVRHVVLLGGGSGITPLMSHVRHLLATEPSTRVTLLYGNRSVRDIIFKDALAQLAEEHAQRFTLRHVLSEPTDGFASGSGMLDKATALRELVVLGLNDDDTTEYLICGPEPMMKAAREALLERGVAEARIHEERFTGPQASEPSRAAQLAEQLVTVRVKGQERAVTVKPGQTILDASLAADLPVDFSCTMGGCGACMAQLVSGTVHMDEPNCLSSAERSSGKILTCIAHPTSPCKLEKL